MKTNSKSETKKIKFTNEPKLPVLYRDIEVNEKEADRILQHGFGSIVFDISHSTPQKGDLLNFKVMESDLFTASWSKLNDLAGTVVNVQAGMKGIRKSYAVVTFVVGDSIKYDVYVKKISDNLNSDNKQQ